MEPAVRDDAHPASRARTSRPRSPAFFAEPIWMSNWWQPATSDASAATRHVSEVPAATTSASAPSSSGASVLASVASARAAVTRGSASELAKASARARVRPATTTGRSVCWSSNSTIGRPALPYPPTTTTAPTVTPRSVYRFGAAPLRLPAARCAVGPPDTWSWLHHRTRRTRSARTRAPTIPRIAGPAQAPRTARGRSPSCAGGELVPRWCHSQHRGVPLRLVGHRGSDSRTLLVA